MANHIETLDSTQTSQNISNDKHMSAKDIQNLYYQLTGKTETVQGRLKEPVIITAHDIIVLHEMLKQCIDQYNHVAEHESIRIFYKNEESETVTSVERFKNMHAKKNHPIMSITLDVNFAIKPQTGDKLNNYKTTIKLNSKLTNFYKENEDLDGHIKYILSTMHHLAPSAEYKIEYVDYTVARSIQSTISEWFHALEKKEESKIKVFLRKHHGKVSWITMPAALMVFASSCYLASTNLNLNDPVTQSHFIIGASTIFWFLMVIFMVLSIAISRHLISQPQLSYINVSRGDELQLNKHMKDSKKGLWSLFFLIIAQIVIGVLCNVIANQLPFN